MTDNANTNNVVDEYQKTKNKEELKGHLISFAMMIVATLIAFGIVASGVMGKIYAIPVLVLLAVVQVAFQFYYFMHLKEKGNSMTALLIYGGIWAAALTVTGLGAITWW
ncbi:cytochrome c oxidase subunit IVB [Virgibacillus sp. 179-BFC.A HS]|uniref:Cytochrome c oxidase subunit IVB n=1 Tax=Tigheibacillus jepli TaxID=3035914 RepID=A0ABU5CI24_9BACI|nr:cytochrome c oxidase subunit IVB [Virgibacillus sp. 179-BFC.A HS]MDY0405994.1 cytochrome c oxidase subunit IVB [Virgibacillus sp. 179-BFC.A HS]